MGKDKKNESLAEGEDKVSYEEKLKYVSVIAKPMASKKLTKKVNRKSVQCEIDRWSVANYSYIKQNNFYSCTNVSRRVSSTRPMCEMG